jgi:hypothetical protein
MARSTGLAPRRGYTIDAATVLVGAVAAGARGRAAATRTGAELILNTRLEAQDVFKIVVHGGAAAAGQYTIQVAHVPEGSTTASTYATVAVITLAPGIQEIPISGVVAGQIARTAPNPDITGDVRVVAIKAVAGTDANAPAGTNTISLQYV